MMLRAEMFEEAWEKVMWWLEEDNIQPRQGMVRLVKGRFLQRATFTTRLASGRVTTTVELRESPQGYWMSAMRGGKRFANFRYDLQDSTFIVGMAMLASHWE